MEITHPRRILAIGLPDASVLSLLKDLTGSAPTPIDSTTAGLTHTWTLQTPYYKVELPIWIDEISDVDTWQREFSKAEAKEVVRALGAWVFCFRKPIAEKEFDVVKSILKAVAHVIQRSCGYGWDGTCLAVGMSQSITPRLQMSFDDWDEVCRGHGFEYIDAESKGRNEFGEPVGMARIKEALETTEWDAGDGDVEDLEDLEDLGAGELEDWGPFAHEEAEMNLELLGVKTALNGEDADPDEAEQVEQLGRMMMKLQAIKDTSSAMPEQEKKKFAAKAVNDMMRSL